MLKKLGVILHVSRDRRLVVKLFSLPHLGAKVYDYSMRRLGIIYDVIGPVRSPYGLVKPDPTIPRLEELVGINVYVREGVGGRGG